MCRGIMKFAGKISEADVSNVTWSVPSFYANKSGERLISPWCSDADAAADVVVVVNGAASAPPTIRLTSTGDTVPSGLRLYELWKRIYRA